MKKYRCGNKLNLLLIVPEPPPNSPPLGGIGNWVVIMKEYIEEHGCVNLNILDVSPISRGVVGRTIWERIVLQGLIMIKKCVELVKLIGNKHIGVIHITTSGEFALVRDILFLLIAKCFSVSTIYHIRFGRIKEIAKNNNLEWSFCKKALSLSTRVICIDKATYNTLVKYFQFNKILYIPNPIKPCYYLDTQKPTDKVVIFLGWVVKTKGIEELLTAWPKIYRKNKEWTLKIVGPCSYDYHCDLKRRYSFDGVELLGEKLHDEAMYILGKAEILILPSYTEGFPNVILEAMALGKAIIATKVGAIPDILYARCGLLINKNNVNEIVDALDKLMHDKLLCMDLGKNAFLKVSSVYSIEKIFTSYLRVWYSVLTKKGGI